MTMEMKNWWQECWGRTAGREQGGQDNHDMTAMTGQREQYSENMDLTDKILEMEGFKFKTAE